MGRHHLGILCVVFLLGGFLVVRTIVGPDSAKFGTIADEAKAAGRTRQTLPAVAKPCDEERPIAAISRAWTRDCW
jgi:hypothetical protein